MKKTKVKKIDSKSEVTQKAIKDRLKKEFGLAVDSFFKGIRKGMQY